MSLNSEMGEDLGVVVAEAMEIESAARDHARSADEDSDHTTVETPEMASETASVAADPAGTEPDEAEAFDWHYGRLDEWVHEWLYPQLAADRTRRRTWCSKWYLHPEAVGVLGALWHQWEVSRLEPMVGMSTFYAHYYLPLLGYLTDSSGTFGACAKASSDEGDTPVHRETGSGYGPPPVLEPDADAAAALAGSKWMPLAADEPPGA